MNMTYSVSAKEERMLYLFKEVGSNMKTWFGNARDNYVVNPVNEGNYTKAAAGVVVGGAGVIMELPDYLISGVIDQRLDPPTGTFGRTRRDIGTLLKDVVTLHPLRSLADASRLAFTDIPMDGLEVITGTQNETHSRVHSLALAA